MISRKEFLQQGVRLLGLAAIAPSLLSHSALPTEPNTPPCDSLEGLPPVEVQKRMELKYVSQSAEPTKGCVNCRFYKQPPQTGDCGGCLLFAGKVKPKGYCVSWAIKF